MILKQATAVDILIGPFVDEDDGKTLEESLTISQGDVMLSKNGQALAQKNDATACAFDDFGCYNCELDATDTDTVGVLSVVVFEDGALPFRRDYQVVEEAVYDALYAASAEGPALPSALAVVDDFLDTEVAAILAAVDTEVAAILADTNELQTDLVNGGRLDLLIDAIKAKTDALPSDPADESSLQAAIAAVAAALAVVDDFLDTEVAAILADTGELQTDWANGGRLDLLIDAIKAKTDALPSDPADESSIQAAIAAVAAALAVVDDFLDTEVAAIKGVTDKLDDTLEDQGGGVYGFTEAALQEAPSGTGGDATAANQATIIAALAVVDDFLDTEVAAIKVKTDALPSDPADASVLAGLIAAVEAKVDIIDTNVDDIETAVGLPGSGVAGAGAITWVIEVDDGVDPIEGAHVWVATDAGQSNVVAGSLITDSFGLATFFLDAGTYYVFVRKDGFNPVLAEEIVVA